MREDVRGQASSQLDRAGAGLHRLGDQLEALRSGDAERAGPLADYAQQLQTRIEEFAERVDRGGLDGVVADLRSFARRRPGTFLAGAAAAGFVAGRMLRSSTGGATTGQTAPGGRQAGTDDGLGPDRQPSVRDQAGAHDLPPLASRGTSDMPFANAAPAGLTPTPATGDSGRQGQSRQGQRRS